MENNKKQPSTEELHEHATELGSWTREMLKPENLSQPYTTIEELMANTWYSEE